MKLYLLLVAVMLPCIGLTQQPDTVGIERQVDSLFKVSFQLANNNTLEQALEVATAAESLVTAHFGQDNVTYGKVCSGYSRLFFTQGDLPAAKAWRLKSLEIQGKYLGKDHLAYAYDLTILSFLDQQMGNILESEQSLIEAKNIYESKLGKSHVKYVEVSVRLATLYAQIDEPEKAEALFLEAKSLFESGLIDKKHFSYSHCLNNLALVYTDLGLIQKAEPLLQQSLEIVKNDLGEDHPEYARSLSNLGSVYMQLKKYDAAEAHLLQAKKIMEKAGKTDAAVYAEITGTLGILYTHFGQFELAEQLTEQSLAVEERLSGRMHFRTAMLLSVLAELSWKKGDFKKAETIYKEALLILATTLGKDHSVYVNTLHGLIDLYWARQRHNEVILLTKEAWEGERQMIIKSTYHLSERELSEQLNTFSLYQQTLYSYSQSPEALAPVSYDNALFHKGFLLNGIQQLKGMSARNPASSEKFNQLKSIQVELAAQYAMPIADRDSSVVVNLEQKATLLEKDLAREVTGYGKAKQQTQWHEIQAALKPGEASIEFVDFQFFNPLETDSVLYAAIILREGYAQPQFIPLFEKKELLPLLRGATGGNNFLKINALYASKPLAAGQKSLYELIWKPLENALKNTTTVYCAPSGLLHYLNLAAIQAPNGKPFGDTRHIVVLGSTRTLVVPNVSATTGNDAYLAGGISYESDSSSLSLANQNIVMRSAALSGAPVFQPDSSATRAGDLNYLPATATEVHEIGKMLHSSNFSVKIDTGFFASEEAFRNLGIGNPSPRVLHLATHGYFFPDPKDKKSKDPGSEPVFKMSDHPMIRSGLIMAGAKQAWLTGKHPVGREDGILTAYEISQMNLSNTELVVLSACETGLGDIAGNEGVYGLQRAFKIAGAKYLIMSLWKVNDQSTKVFMTTFYEAWLTQKLSIPVAFRQTQAKMRKKYPDPYDWAGFILIE